MKQKTLFTFIGILMIFAIFGPFQSWKKNSIISRQQSSIDSLTLALIKTKAEKDNLEQKLYKIHTIKFKRTFNTFKKYNPLIDTSTVETFLKVIQFYKLDSTTSLFNMCIAQLCHESGAKHHIKNKVIESNGNALGISQIVPTTAFQYLRYTLSEKEKENMIKLGATPFRWIKKYNYKYKEVIYEDSTVTNLPYVGPYARTEIKNWLYSETNNIILWGYIMKHTLEANNYNLNKSLLTYNQGQGFVFKYIKKGGNVWEHDYVQKINWISKNINT